MQYKDTKNRKISVSEDLPEYKRRMKTGKHSRKDGWVESEELDYNYMFWTSINSREEPTT